MPLRVGMMPVFVTPTYLSLPMRKLRGSWLTSARSIFSASFGGFLTTAGACASAETSCTTAAGAWAAHDVPGSCALPSMTATATESNVFFLKLIMKSSLLF